jgi:hypothetical protein
MGWRLELSDVTVTPLFPPAFAALSVAEFMARLPELDADFAERAAAAAARGEALRYAATIEGGKLTVGPASVPLGSPLGSLGGTDNLCEFYTGWCAPRPDAHADATDARTRTADARNRRARRCPAELPALAWLQRARALAFAHTYTARSLSRSRSSSLSLSLALTLPSALPSSALDRSFLPSFKPFPSLCRYPTSPLVVRGAGAGAGTTAAGILADMVELAFAASVDFKPSRLGAARAESHPSFEE